MIAYYCLFCAFVIGAVVGSFLNVVIARLPLEKSVLWPGSRCGSCFQPVRWFDNLPLLSYLFLLGRCRTCKARFSPRYFVVELVCGLGFAGLFYLEVMENIHQWPLRGRDWEIGRGIYPWQWWLVWLFHATLFAFLLAASVCDLDGREIPLPLTVTGTVVGLVGAVLLPWPWPWQLSEHPLPAVVEGFPSSEAWKIESSGLKTGAYAWPVWGPIPSWLEPGDWRLGLATGVAGMLVGTWLMRGVGFLFSKGLGREALGLGDADLMMMAGAFLGWQPVVVSFFLSVIPALVFGVIRIVIYRDNELPFGPSLAGGVVLTFLGWHWLGPALQPLFFWGGMLLGVAVLGGSFMLLSSYVIRVSKGQ